MSGGLSESEVESAVSKSTISSVVQLTDDMQRVNERITVTQSDVAQNKNLIKTTRGFVETNVTEINELGERAALLRQDLDENTKQDAAQSKKIEALSADIAQIVLRLSPSQEFSTVQTLAYEQNVQRLNELHEYVTGKVKEVIQDRLPELESGVAAYLKDVDTRAIQDEQRQKAWEKQNRLFQIIFGVALTFAGAIATVWYNGTIGADFERVQRNQSDVEEQLSELQVQVNSAIENTNRKQEELSKSLFESRGTRAEDVSQNAEIEFLQREVEELKRQVN